MGGDQQVFLGQKLPKDFPAWAIIVIAFGVVVILATIIGGVVWRKRRAANSVAEGKVPSKVDEDSAIKDVDTNACADAEEGKVNAAAHAETGSASIEDAKKIESGSTEELNA